MSEKLKTCPFCGSVAKIQKYTCNGEEFEAVQCSGCHVHNANVATNDHIANWNARTESEEIERLKKALRIIRELRRNKTVPNHGDDRIYNIATEALK